MSKKNAFSQAFSELISSAGSTTNTAATEATKTGSSEMKPDLAAPLVSEQYRQNRTGAAGPSSAAKATVIAAGTTVEGNMAVEGPAEIQGRLHGNIECSGCLTVSGEIVGGSKAAEMDVQGARIEGSIESSGNVQIRNGAVVIGNVRGQAMQVFGAIKGDVTLPGHLTIGSTAIILGNIQVGSIDIQNGAAIDGHVSVQTSGKASSIFELDKRTNS